MKRGLTMLVLFLLNGLVSAPAGAQVTFNLTSVPVFATSGDPSAPLGSVSLTAGNSATMNAGSQLFFFYQVGALLGGGASVTCSAAGCARPTNFTFAVSGNQVAITFVTDVTFNVGNSITVSGLDFNATGYMMGTQISATASAIGAVITIPAVAAVAQIISPPSVVLSPTSLNFGNELVGIASSSKTVTLSNTGGGSLNISSIAASPSVFVQNNTCGSSVAGGGNCTISVVFAPIAAGAILGSLTINDNAPGSPQTVALHGTGLNGPTLSSLSPSTFEAGSPSIVLTVIGANFISGSVVRWNGSDLATTDVSNTILTATIPASYLASPVSALVTVFNPGPSGGIISNPLTFSATAAGSSPIPAGAVQTVIPHSAFGGGWITRLFVANLTNSYNTVTINRINQTGILVDSRPTILPPAGEIYMADSESQRSLPLTINWFVIGSDGPVIASVLFDFQGAAAPAPVDFNTALGALASPPLWAFTALARVTTPGGDLGLALANLNISPITVTVKLFDAGGNLVAQDSVTLGPFAQTAFDLTQDAAFSSILRSTNEFVGTLTATTSDATKPVSALVVGANLNQLYSLPVVSGVPK
jgi:hypothetical protein